MSDDGKKQPGSDEPKWKQRDSDELKQRLSDIEYSVTQLKDTER